MLFEVWGCRGSRNLVPPVSAVGNYTSCYSLVDGADLFVLDAGRGIGGLSTALAREGRFAAVRNVFILISHAHMDHWEGLKDAEWMWRGSSRKVTVVAPGEAIGVIGRGYEHPAYVSLDQLAAVAGQSIEFRTIAAGESFELGGARIETHALNHFSGHQHKRSPLETVGYRIRSASGAAVAYFSDHQPDETTAAMEREVLQNGPALALFDSHYASIAEHNFGHGSIEYAARIARDYPAVMILAGHHGATATDEEIRDAFRRYSAELSNFQLAVEGSSFEWADRTSGWSAGPLSVVR